MPAKTEQQRKAAGAALSAKRGKMSADKLFGAAKEMYMSMTAKELEKMASSMGAKHDSEHEKDDKEMMMDKKKKMMK